MAHSPLANIFTWEATKPPQSPDSDRNTLNTISASLLQSITTRKNTKHISKPVWNVVAYTKSTSLTYRAYGEKGRIMATACVVFIPFFFAFAIGGFITDYFMW